MTAAVLALAAAVLTTITYLVLTAHLDYASVRRRQLDAWAAAAALVCFGTILLGNASVRRAERATLTPEPLPSGPETLPVPRMTAIVPDRDTPLEAPVEAGQLVAIVAPPDGGDTVADGPAAAELDQRTGTRGGGGKRVPPTPQEGGDEVVYVLPSATPLPTATPLVRLRPSPSPWPTALLPAPTTEPPTDVPPPLPTATPHCGDPTEIDIEVANMRTRRRNQGGDLVVEYSLDVRNHSAFPVTLRDIRATVSRLGGGGQEQYATQLLTDVTIEAGAVYPLASRVVLETRPPPVGQVQFCLTYATETCGQYNRSGNTRCQVVEGFWEDDAP